METARSTGIELVTAGDSGADATVSGLGVAEGGATKMAALNFQTMAAACAVGPQSRPLPYPAPRLGAIHKCKCAADSAWAGLDSEFPEFSLPHFVFQHLYRCMAAPGASSSPCTPLQTNPLLLQVQLLELVQAEDEVRRCITQHRAAVMSSNAPTLLLRAPNRLPSASVGQILIMARLC